MDITLNTTLQVSPATGDGTVGARPPEPDLFASMLAGTQAPPGPEPPPGLQINPGEGVAIKPNASIHKLDLRPIDQDGKPPVAVLPGPPKATDAKSKQVLQVLKGIDPMQNAAFAVVLAGSQGAAAKNGGMQFDVALTAPGTQKITTGGPDAGKGTPPVSTTPILSGGKTGGESDAGTDEVIGGSPIAGGPAGTDEIIDPAKGLTPITGAGTDEVIDPAKGLTPVGSTGTGPDVPTQSNGPAGTDEIIGGVQAGGPDQVTGVGNAPIASTDQIIAGLGAAGASTDPILSVKGDTKDGSSNAGTDEVITHPSGNSSATTDQVLSNGKTVIDPGKGQTNPPTIGAPGALPTVLTDTVAKITVINTAAAKDAIAVKQAPRDADEFVQVKSKSVSVEKDPKATAGTAPKQEVNPPLSKPQNTQAGTDEILSGQGGATSNGNTGNDGSGKKGDKMPELKIVSKTDLNGKPVAETQPIMSTGSTDPLQATGKIAPRAIPQTEMQAVIDQISGRVQAMAVKNQGQVTIDLHPKDLGSITLIVKNLGDSLSTQMLASDDNVRQALDGNRHQLTQAMQARGLTVSEIKVSGQPMQAGLSSDQQANQGQPQQTPRQQAQAATHFAGDVRPDKAVARETAKSASGVDFRA